MGDVSNTVKVFLLMSALGFIAGILACVICNVVGLPETVAVDGSLSSFAMVFSLFTLLIVLAIK